MNANRVSFFTLVLLVFLLSCSEDKKDFTNIKLARFYIEHKNDVLALQSLVAELKTGRNLQEAHRLMGTIFNKAGFYGDAVSHYQSAIKLGCNRVCVEGLFDAYLGLGKISSAEQEFSTNIFDKSTESSKYRLAMFEFFKYKNYQQTINQLEIIDFPAAKYWILKLMFEQGRYVEIITSFDKAANYSEDQLLLFAEAHYLLKEYKKSNDILSMLRLKQTGQLLTKRKIQAIDLSVKVNTALGKFEYAEIIYKEFLKKYDGTSYVSFKKALTHLSKGDFDAVIDDIDVLAKTYPENNSVVLALAMAQYGKKNYQEVIASLGNIRGGINEHSLNLLASAYNEMNRPQETINLLQGIEKNKMLTVLLSRAYFLKRDYKKAQILLDEIVIDSKPDPGDQKLAELWFDLGQFNKIITAFSPNPGNPPAIKYLLVSSYLKLQKISVARQYVGNETDPVLSRGMLAYLEGSIGNLDKAIQVYDDLVRLKPDKNSYILLSSSYIKKKDYPNALKTIQAGTRLDGDNRLLLDLANRIMLERKDFETFQWLESFKTDHLDYKKVQKMLANFEIHQNQNEKAIQRLTQFIQDGDKQIYYLMALAKKDSDRAESVRLMEKSLSTEFSLAAASRLQNYYQRINDTKNLERINSQIEQFGGINIRTAELLARGYFFLQAISKATKLANILMEQGQTDAGNELLGDILAHQGKYSEAVTIYSQVITNSVSEKLLLKYFTTKIKINAENVLAVLGEADDMLVKAPKMYDLRKLIGTRYIDRDNNAAVAHLKPLVDKFPNDIVLLNNLAWASLDLDPGAALKYSTKAYHINSDNFKIIDTHVRALKENNQIASARDLLKNKIRENPDDHQLKSLLDYLK